MTLPGSGQAKRFAARAIPRLRRRGRTAFVLSGGGVLGAVQVGQMAALLEAGIIPDLLVGASVGALNAAAVASDPTPRGVAVLQQVWESLSTEDIFPGSRMQRAMHFVRKGDHLYPNTGLRRLIAHVPARSFEQLQRPLEIVSANLRSGKETWFNTGALKPAILASTALPGVFPPVLVNGEMYVDGGVVNNVPISRAVELGATTIYILTCGLARQGERTIRRPLDVLLQAVVQSRAARVEEDVERFGERAKLIMLPTPDTSRIRFSDPTRSAELIATSRALTADVLADRVPAVTQ